MDPFSAALGITIAAGTTIQTIADLINRIQDGPQHVKDLSEDIRHLDCFLHHAQEVLRVDCISDSVLSDTANGLIQTIQKLNRELEQLSYQVKKGKGLQGKDEIRRFKWLFSERICRKLQARIKFYRDELSCSIELMNLWVHSNRQSLEVSD